MDLTQNSMVFHLNKAKKKKIDKVGAGHGEDGREEKGKEQERETETRGGRKWREVDNRRKRSEHRKCSLKQAID